MRKQISNVRYGSRRCAKGAEGRLALVLAGAGGARGGSLAAQPSNCGDLDARQLGGAEHCARCARALRGGARPPAAQFDARRRDAELTLEARRARSARRWRAARLERPPAPLPAHLFGALLLPPEPAPVNRSPRTQDGRLASAFAPLGL